MDDGETRAELHYKPIGVVAAIGPWNWPMMIAIWQIAPPCAWATPSSSNPPATPRSPS
ncbi:acyl-CoA reductase-like NAD-dependent aldehyde dehydrogenase [Pseudarthrobacter oxydans]|uniref:Acyl-CoA reductase-like NAD-dependent aldehyde dehydrogenase n=1 Tax=Pseudarthrobacter oxydans TaxID=1671 RepID=A0AAW8NFD3_PSEOX|nr:acyl-CoA reductase-like NAD-dependent aldehyde dehydrogenase [Pseudarthrobacter oxydans]MDR7165104.1 acyl-CoA reductase-like NAD-dependent aldehyde dehydrogenase [Pseudarthrobacter oxydans]